MNTKLTVMIAALCMSASVFAQTQPTGKPSTSGTSYTGTPTAGQSTTNSGEQNATTMQNNSNTQNTTTPTNAQRGKADKSMNKSKLGADCAQGHTDGHATAPTHTGTASAEGCENKTLKR
jgi:hypothetical protein